MAIVPYAHNQVLVDDSYTSGAPLVLSLGSGPAAGSATVQVLNTGGAAVFVRLNDATNQTNWTRIRPDNEGYLALITSAVFNLEVYKADEPRYINMHSSKTPDQVFSTLEITRHA
jgi:hypothetical protein